MAKIKRPKDSNQLAKLIVDISTGQKEDKKKSKTLKKKTLDKKPKSSKKK